MKRYFAAILAIMILILIPFAAGAEFKKTKVAVLDFDLKGRGFETEDMGGIVAEWFITALVKEGRFDVIERGLLRKIMKEHALGMSGIVDEDTATRLGKILGVKVIISGSVLKLENILEINARIIDVETASIIAAENVKSTAAAQLQDLVVLMASKIINNFPLEGYVVSREKGEKVIAIDLGKKAGVKSNMEFFVYKEGKVIKHPKTGEVLDIQTIKIGKIVISNVRDKMSHGEITEENTPGMIRFGHRVESIGPLVPATTGMTIKKAVKKSRRDSRRKRTRPSTVTEIAELLRSPNMTDKTIGARYAVKLFPTNPMLLEIAESELLNHYEIRTNNKAHVNAMAWLCNMLGRSRNREYKDTLYKVARKAGNRRLRGYANKNYRMLR